MLSAVEHDYLTSPERFKADYAYVLKHRIRIKVQALHDEMALLGNAGYLTENCNNLTDYSKMRTSEQSLNQAALSERWCSGRDSDPGLRLERPEYLTGLYYRSALFFREHHASVFRLE